MGGVPSNSAFGGYGGGASMFGAPSNGMFGGNLGAPVVGGFGNMPGYYPSTPGGKGGGGMPMFGQSYGSPYGTGMPYGSPYGSPGGKAPNMNVGGPVTQQGVPAPSAQGGG